MTLLECDSELFNMVHAYGSVSYREEVQAVLDYLKPHVPKTEDYIDYSDRCKRSSYMDVATQLNDGTSMHVLLSRYADMLRNYFRLDRSVHYRMYRIEDDTRQALKLISRDNHPAPWEYPGLISFDSKAMMVEYYTTNDHAKNDRRTKTRLGRYLRKIEWKEYHINEAVNKINVHYNLIDTLPLQWADDADAIQEVYENGPSSCMSYSMDCNEFSSHIHPVRVYDTPDISIAYIRDEDGDIVARTVVNLIDKHYTEIYGNSTLLMAILDREGYEQGSLQGCRLRKISDSRVEYVMPYIDGGVDNIAHADDGYFIVVSCGEYQASYTNGGVSEGTFDCESCGYEFSMDERYTDDYGDDPMCYDCHDSRGEED